MPVPYDYDQELNIVHARPYGEVRLLEILKFYQEILDDDEIAQGAIEVVHFENIKDF